MKRLLFFLIIISTANHLYAQNAKEMAQEFMQRYTELEDGSYQKANKEKLLLVNNYVQYDVTPIAGSDHSVMNANPDDLEFILTVNRNNPKCEKFGKEMVKAMQIIGKNKGYQCYTIDQDMTILYKGSEEIMTYMHEQYVDIYPKEYAHFHICFAKPYSSYLANESNYPNGLPTKLTASTAPQIIEIKDAEKNRSLVMNGLFINNKITSGIIRLKGYHKFMDGIWLNRRWQYEDKETNNVCFVPETTKDTISGHMDGLDFSTFRADQRYFDRLKPSRLSPLWIQNEYVTYDNERDQQRQKEYEDKERQSHSITYDQIDAQRQASYAQDSGQHSGTQTSGGSTTTYSSFTKCSVCNGYGYTEYDCGQGGGHPCRKSCSACNSMGQVHH